MASQVFIAHSDTFSGLAMVAGPAYGCSQGTPFGAIRCIQHPKQTMMEEALDRITELYRKELIASPSNIRTSKIFILHGGIDSLVASENAQVNLELFSHLSSLTSVKLHIESYMEHTFPTSQPTGISCGERVSPFISQCPVDAAQMLLEHLDSQTSPLDLQIQTQTTVRFPGSLQTFSQSDYDLSRLAHLYDRGHIYIPPACHKGKSCGLHITLHGCEQSPEKIDDLFVHLTSYTVEAQARNLVVLFPSVKKSLYNPKGCWDWWGYTGPLYLTRQAPQIRAIKAMTEALITNPIPSY